MIHLQRFTAGLVILSLIGFGGLLGTWINHTFPGLIDYLLRIGLVVGGVLTITYLLGMFIFPPKAESEFPPVYPDESMNHDDISS